MLDLHNSSKPIEVKGPLNPWAVLGFLYFFAAIGIVIMAAMYFSGERWIAIPTIVVGFPFVFVLMKKEPNIQKRHRYNSFFVGAGFAFLLTIVVFFGAIIWAVTR